MVVGSKVDGGAQQQVLPPAVEKTIRSIKEIVGNHSDEYIYAMLKDSNMDPNETAQKLLYQDPFHEVKRKRDKKKEVGWRSARDGGRQVADSGRTMEGGHVALVQNTVIKGPTEPRKYTEHMVQWTRSHASWDRNTRRGGYVRNALPGINREFRVVRDNRLNQNTDRDAIAETSPHPASGNEQEVANIPEKSSSGLLADQRHTAARNSEGKFSSQGINGPHKPNQGHSKDADLSGSHGQSAGESQATASNSSARKEAGHNFQMHSASRTLANSVVGVYASSSDPVHVPSPESRSAGTVGAIRREVGVVGVRRQSSERATSHSSTPHNSFSVPLLGNDSSTSTESTGHSTSLPKSNQLSQSPASEATMPSVPVTRPFSSHQYNNKVHQQSLGHQKASQPNMEWKPKSSQKTSAISPGVLETSSAPESSHPDTSRSSMVETTGLSDKLSQANILENEHVIIPPHLRVPEAEKSGLTFGSFGAGFDSTKGLTSAFQAFGNSEEPINEPSVSTSTSIPVGPTEDISADDQIELVDGLARTSRSDSPASANASEQPQRENIDSLSPRSMENYADIGLVQSNSPSYNPSEQQMQNPSGLPTFSEAYDPQSSYDVPFFRSAMEENVHGQRLASPSEAIHSHVANSSPPSSVTMMQQQPLAQPQALAQLYPQVHIPHFPNFVPYRQFVSPLYVPPMAMPNYTNNPAYPHPSNGSSYVLMPGASSHLTAGGMKYATSQYKQVSGGSPTAYGNYTNPAGYAISAPGTVGAAAGLDDVSRMKYKDNSLYVPNPQAEPSELWIQTPRDLSSMQSAAPYYNLSGQAPHAAYLPTHTGHASFNAAAAQSSHMQFPGLYHPPQPATMTNPHHLVHQQVPPGMGGNVGVGVATPGPQVGTYQQPQLGHLNWTGNF